jgi:hypothetical protein
MSPDWDIGQLLITGLTLHGWIGLGLDCGWVGKGAQVGVFFAIDQTQTQSNPNPTHKQNKGADFLRHKH